MFRKALSPFVKVVPAAGTSKTMGLPLTLAVGSKVNPAGCSSIPAKMAARRTDTKVKNAESVASLERVLNVLGKEQTHEMTVMITEKEIEHMEWLVIVFKYLAPTKTCRP